jgi:hypothetical protein
MCKEQKNNRKLERMKVMQIKESITEKEMDSNRMKRKRERETKEERKRTEMELHNCVLV